MYAVCPVCFDELGPHNTPVAMPCGHLYCLDCATFWFNQADDVPQKCTCGRMFRGDEIIKLYLGAGPSSSSTPVPVPGPSRLPISVQKDTDTDRRGRDALTACRAAAAALEGSDGSQDAALSAALSMTQLFVESVPEADQAAGIQNLLKSIRTLLVDIRKLIDRDPQPRQTIADQERLSAATREISTMRAKMATDIQEIFQQNLIQEDLSRRAQAEHERKEHEMVVRLQDMRRALDTARRCLDASRANEAEVKADFDRARKSELRYKKKYYALKQEVETARRLARNSPRRADPEDELLLIG